MDRDKIYSDMTKYDNLLKDAKHIKRNNKAIKMRLNAISEELFIFYTFIHENSKIDLNNCNLTKYRAGWLMRAQYQRSLKDE